MNKGESLVLTVEQAAEFLSMSRQMVYDLINEGSLRSFKIGRSRRIVRTDLEAFVYSLVNRESHEDVVQ